MVGLYKKFTLQVMAIFVAFTNPIAQNLMVWLETTNEALFKCVKPLTILALPIIDQKLATLDVHIQIVQHVSSSVGLSHVLKVQTGKRQV